MSKSHSDFYIPICEQISFIEAKLVSKNFLFAGFPLLTAFLFVTAMTVIGYHNRCDLNRSALFTIHSDAKP